MFTWLRELILDPIKEGVAEVKQEAAQEKEEQRIRDEGDKENFRLQQEENRRRIMAIPYSEKFAAAIAAPFRATYLSPWPPFGRVGQNDEIEIWPLSLYSFGEPDSVADDKRNVLKDCLARDLNITDHQSALTVIASYLNAGDISGKLSGKGDKVPQSLNSVLWTLQNAAGTIYAAKAKAAIASLHTQKALLSCMMAYAITGSADCNYLSKDYALDLLSDVSAYVKANYSGWKIYGDEFLTGEKMAKLNNAIGRSFLHKFTGYLNSKPGSPWLNVSWEPID